MFICNFCKKVRISWIFSNDIIERDKLRDSERSDLDRYYSRETYPVPVNISPDPQLQVYGPKGEELVVSSSDEEKGWNLY